MGKRVLHGADEVRAAVGEHLGTSDWLEITQERVDGFAESTGDHQWIHTDPERAARESPFGTTIAHGTLTLAMIDGFRDELTAPLRGSARLGVNIGYDRVRFPAPVRTGSRVRATMQITGVAEKEGGWVQVVQRFTVEVEGEPRPACVADSLVRILVGSGT